MKRLLSLDILRGFLIFYVIFIHAVLLIIFQANYDYVDILPFWLIALIFPLLLIAMWGPMFSMISATINTCLVHNQLEKGKPLRSVLSKRMWNYLLIIIVHIINTIFFIHFIPLDDTIYRSLLCGYLETGYLSLPSILMFLNSGTLLLIGLSGLFINLVFLFIWKNNGHKRNKTTIGVFIGLSIIFLLIRPLILPLIDTFILDLAGQKNYVTAILLSWMFRGQFGFIPMAAFSFFGVLLGVLQATNVNKQKILKIWITTIVCLIILSGIFIGIYGIPDLTLLYWPIAMVTVNLAIMFTVLIFCILRFDYASDHKVKKRVNRSLFFRRFNMITLTIFVFESIISVLWAKIFTFFLNDPFPYNILADFVFLFCVIGTWYVILRIWERIDFKYSIEWVMMKIISKLTGSTSHKLDVTSVLYHPLSSRENK